VGVCARGLLRPQACVAQAGSARRRWEVVGGSLDALLRGCACKGLERTHAAEPHYMHTARTCEGRAGLHASRPCTMPLCGR